MTPLDEHGALLAAARSVLQPLARLMVARGVTAGALEDVLKSAMVEAARHELPNGTGHRQVSRLSAATGIGRREVNRLLKAADAGPTPQRSLAAELFTRWRTSPAFQDARGRPVALPRQGPAPSFEALARSVTQDVHPRTLLDELVRLGIAGHVPERDVVVLTLDAFVPSADSARMLDFLAHNCGDHLGAAVGNVLGGAPRNLERAVFATGLSKASIDVADHWVNEAWATMLGQLVPLLEQLLARDEEMGEAEPRPYRFRAGLYAFTHGDAPPDHAEHEAAAALAALPGHAPFEHDLIEEFSTHEHH